MSNYVNSARNRKTRNQIRQKLIEQRVMAVVMILLSVLAVVMTASAGEDSTGGFVIGAIGLYLLATKHVVIY